MTKVAVYGGACKNKVTIEAKREGTTVKLSMESTCDDVMKLAEDLQYVSFDDIIPRKAKLPTFIDVVVYVKSARHLKHFDCPVPCAILKAVMAEFGLQLKKSPEIRFIE